MIDCNAESFVPLPTRASLPTLTYEELRRRAKAACNAALLLQAEGCEDQPNIEFVQTIAHNALRKAAEGKDIVAAEAASAMSTPEGALYVEQILSAYDMEIVRDARRLRNFVTNKLIVESENMDARIRMKALELLGKISNVGLFTDRTEITVNNRSTVELEESLRDKIRKLVDKQNVEDAKILMPTIKNTQLQPDKIPDVRQILGG